MAIAAKHRGCAQSNYASTANDDFAHPFPQDFVGPQVAGPSLFKTKPQ
ncbi:hypothetical protein ACFQZO_28835 [Bradyrhizobium sp. GCM10027634]|nr:MULTISPECIES: hypothetical protein [unclassified Bradyrhizobium]MDN5004864.1 hypothetical protein [Bradyrhizobium sp. WYCCWR 12677]